MAKKKTKRPEAEEVKSEPRIHIEPEKPVEEQIALNALAGLFPNSYEAVVAAARRARQLNLGLHPLIRTNMRRPVDIALTELAAGKISYEIAEEDIERGSSQPKAKSRKK